MTRDRILAAVLTASFLVAAFIAFDAITPPVSAGEDPVIVESTTTIPVIDTTTTTVDLSFLNTATTTQAPVAEIPQYSNPAPVTVEATTDRWDQLAQCESGGNWAYPPVAGGFSGGIMFHIGTWRGSGGLEFASDAYLATREQQIIVAERVLASSGWSAWPGCSRRFGWL